MACFPGLPDTVLEKYPLVKNYFDQSGLDLRVVPYQGKEWKDGIGESIVYVNNVKVTGQPWAASLVFDHETNSWYATTNLNGQKTAINPISSMAGNKQTWDEIKENLHDPKKWTLIEMDEN